MCLLPSCTVRFERLSSRKSTETRITLTTRTETQERRESMGKQLLLPVLHPDTKTHWNQRIIQRDHLLVDRPLP